MAAPRPGWPPVAGPIPDVVGRGPAVAVDAQPQARTTGDRPAQRSPRGPAIRRACGTDRRRRRAEGPAPPAVSVEDLAFVAAVHPDRLLAYKAYSTRRIRESLRRRCIKATIPEPSNQIAGRSARGSKGGRPPAFDQTIYKDRNTVERAINRLRGYRAVATRYDKREFVYKGTIDVACIGIWLRNPTSQDSQDTA